MIDSGLFSSYANAALEGLASNVSKKHKILSHANELTTMNYSKAKTVNMWNMHFHPRLRASQGEKCAPGGGTLVFMNLEINMISAKMLSNVGQVIESKPQGKTLRTG